MVDTTPTSSQIGLGRMFGVNYSKIGSIKNALKRSSILISSMRDISTLSKADYRDDTRKALKWVRYSILDMSRSWTEIKMRMDETDPNFRPKHISDITWIDQRLKKLNYDIGACIHHVNSIEERMTISVAKSSLRVLRAYIDQLGITWWLVREAYLKPKEYVDFERRKEVREDQVLKNCV